MNSKFVVLFVSHTSNTLWIGLIKDESVLKTCRIVFCPPVRWLNWNALLQVQQYTVSSFLRKAHCVFLCFSYRHPIIPQQDPRSVGVTAWLHNLSPWSHHCFHAMVWIVTVVSQQDDVILTLVLQQPPCKHTAQPFLHIPGQAEAS